MVGSGEQMIHAEAEIAREDTSRARARRHGIRTCGSGEQRLQHAAIVELDAHERARSRLLEPSDGKRLTDPTARAANAPAGAQATGLLDHDGRCQGAAGRRQQRYDGRAGRLQQRRLPQNLGHGAGALAQLEQRGRQRVRAYLGRAHRQGENAEEKRSTPHGRDSASSASGKMNARRSARRPSLRARSARSRRSAARAAARMFSLGSRPGVTARTQTRCSP